MIFLVFTYKEILILDITWVKLEITTKLLSPISGEVVFNIYLGGWVNLIITQHLGGLLLSFLIFKLNLGLVFFNST